MHCDKHGTLDYYPCCIEEDMEQNKAQKSFIYTFEKGKQVIVTNYKENCWVLNSFTIRNKVLSDGVNTTTSFMYYDGRNQTVEWCPSNLGPISVNTKCGEDSEYARKDIFLGFAQNDWSQLAVDDNGLYELSLYDIDTIFSVLRDHVS